MARRKAEPIDAITKDIHRDVKIFLDNRDMKWTDIIEWSTGPVEPSNEEELVFQFPQGEDWRYAGISVCVEKSFDKRTPKARSKRAKVLIDPAKLVIQTEDHGGYLAGKCVACDASGWFGQIRHEPSCVAVGIQDQDVKV